MFCSYCKNVRVKRGGTCKKCGMPVSFSRHVDWEVKDDAVVAPRPGIHEEMWLQVERPGTSYSGLWEHEIPQLSFDSAETIPPYVAATWSQSAHLKVPALAGPLPASPLTGPQTLIRTTQALALLPVPYRYETAVEPQGRQPTMTLQLVPENAVSHLLSTPIATPEVIYVPPMYVKPRPVIPGYRVVSGLLSVFIVTLLLCAGVGYYSKASGTLDALSRFYNGTPPRSVQTAHSPRLPDPPTKIDRGPAYTIISSATTTSRIDAKNEPLNIDNSFAVNRIFYVTYSANVPKADGKVYVKWYTNDMLYRTMTSNTPIKANSFVSGSVSMAYAQPAEGKVELYWNNQLAQRLYFVVR